MLIKYRTKLQKKNRVKESNLIIDFLIEEMKVNYLVHHCQSNKQFYLFDLY